MSDPISVPTYVLYSPTMDKYMLIEVVVGLNGPYHNMLWVNTFDVATRLNDWLIEHILEMCETVANETGMVISPESQQDWFRSVAYGFTRLGVDRVVDDLMEYMLVPIIPPDEIDLTLTELDFTIAERLFEGVY